MTIPAVPLPKGSGGRVPLDFKLKPEWRYDTRRRQFVSASGERYAPRGELPRDSRIVYKVPVLARAAASDLNPHERDLQRYMQIILPTGVSPARYLRAVRSWPAVEEAHVGPEVSLPQQD